MASFEKRSITAESAQLAIQGASAKAQQLGHAMSIVIADEAGLIKCSLRMDGASDLTLNIATDKAAHFCQPWHGHQRALGHDQE